MTRRAWIEASAALPRLYHWAYDAGWLRAQAAPLPIVSVGSLTMGGAGKTPFTELVAHRLERRGHRVAIVSRGYGRRSRGSLVVSRGDGPRVDVREAGDEPFLLARRTRALVVVSTDRVEGARIADDEGADVVVLDDGFQHRRLRRDLDVVLVDADPAHRFVLPFGSGREAPSSLSRADLVVTVQVTPDRGDRTIAPGAIRAIVAPEPWRTIGNEPTDAPSGPVMLVSAIARPERFAQLVRTLGAKVCGHLRFRDHRWLTNRDIDRARKAAARRGAVLVTTEKDAVRWPEGEDGDVWVLPVRMSLLCGETRLDEALRKAVA